MHLIRKAEGVWVVVAEVLVALSTALLAYQHLIAVEFERERNFARIEALSEANYSLLRSVKEKSGTIAEFQAQIGDITSTLGTLEKLTSVDKELLKKYSKVYFLNENYTPKSLSEVPPIYRLATATNYQILSPVGPYLERLLRDARGEGYNILVVSAYRSYSAQSSLKSQYTVSYGSGANKFSADQGYSEHQLGTAVDLTTGKLGANFNTFADTTSYQWLLANAYKYGFVLSYPKGNAYYIFEPWHWRFVGIALATYLHNEGKNFYDLDQREIDNYLVKFFE